MHLFSFPFLFTNPSTQPIRYPSTIHSSVHLFVIRVSARSLAEVTKMRRYANHTTFKASKSNGENAQNAEVAPDAQHAGNAGNLVTRKDLQIKPVSVQEGRSALGRKRRVVEVEIERGNLVD
ncbi:hypothetical protein VTL71DRAFT_2631 [Oculimacula yallundae]|uniref:Uncharacterized protein n=1 Tax=Oculimacula yallundae TaxID=86028 RepID=A0ABR4C9H0_9HELO